MAARMGMPSLSLRHGFRCVTEAAVTVEEFLVAVGEKEGLDYMFPALIVSAAIGAFEEDVGMLLSFDTPELGEFKEVGKKAMYRTCVKVSHASSLEGVKLTRRESQWLDSVSLLIKDSFEGEMLMIDNLSGSVFHHYSSTSSPVWKDYKGNLQEIRLAEVEQASLMSEQFSDKSSSLALPDDLSLDDHSDYQLLVRDGKEERGSSDSHSSEELRGFRLGVEGVGGTEVLDPTAEALKMG
ncbi:uncharacterized protein LOC127925704 [Oncorhynchus keta]|uniref:uncharacterized protein LOC127925704 n=1 Tax=Oncorhynchus keta TaxID=8018 RepID=UPI00227C9015|nr:uncharacterized protein LOC127925704 [Oncorhynchus keta]